MKIVLIMMMLTFTSVFSVHYVYFLIFFIYYSSTAIQSVYADGIPATCSGTQCMKKKYQLQITSSSELNSYYS